MYFLLRLVGWSLAIWSASLSSGIDTLSRLLIIDAGRVGLPYIYFFLSILSVSRSLPIDIKCHREKMTL